MKYSYEKDLERVSSYYFGISRPPIVVNTDVSSFGFRRSQETRKQVVDTSSSYTLEEDPTVLIDKNSLTLSSIVDTTNLKQNQVQFDKGEYKMEYSPYRTVSEIPIPKRTLDNITQVNQKYVNSLLKERQINSMKNTKIIGETYSSS